MRRGVLSLGLFSAAMCLAGTSYAFAAAHSAGRRADSSHMLASRQHASDVHKKDTALPNDSGLHASSVGVHSVHHMRQHEGWAGDTAPNPNDHDPNPIYPI